MKKNKCPKCKSTNVNIGGNFTNKGHEFVIVCKNCGKTTKAPIN